jgi:glutathione synthase/RimK-type ligase-like ATP-grasp enzyme
MYDYIVTNPMETVIVIGNCNPNYSYYENALPKEIKKINMKPVFMYDIGYLDNSEKDLEDDTKQSLYEDVIQFTQNNKDTTIKLLKTMKIIAIIPNGEESVLDAEFFSDKMNTLSNPIETSTARRDKYDMQERIKKMGLNSIRQKRCNKISELIEFVSNNPNIQYVIKPVRGAATEDVYLCSNLEELKDKFTIIMNKDINQAGANDKYCLVQEYIDGEEWIVNTVSRNGHHKIINVMKYKKSQINGVNFVYLETRLVDPNDVPSELYSYSNNILNALEIENGAAHAEIKMSSNGPCLIEVGARIGGGQVRDYIADCIGKTTNGTKYNQGIATVYAYCSKTLFDTIPDRYILKNSGATVFCNALYDNVLWKDIYLKILMKDINTIVIVKDTKTLYKEDEIIKKTTDFYTDLVDFDIISDNEESLDEAIRLIRIWEKNIPSIAKDNGGITNIVWYYIRLYSNVFFYLLFFVLFLTGFIMYMYRIKIKFTRGKKYTSRVK